ncbi:threonine synthase, partial [Magnetococcales bacterium HHB-1]
SPVQERQMTTVLDENVHNIAIRGNFDDGQAIVKALFNDLDFKKKYHLGAVNSINWARILAQIVYYFYAYGRVYGASQEEAVFSVPTGNFGDIFAGYLAKRMGLPMKKLILATNHNDILHRFVKSGAYTRGEVTPSISPSMDIQISSNFERYLYYLLGEKPGAVRQAMQQLGEKGGFKVSEAELKQAQRDFSSQSANEKETLAQITKTHEQSGYTLDPHTAVGVCAAEKENASGAICLATAHPAKFGGAVKEALGEIEAPPESIRQLMDMETRCKVVDPEVKAVKTIICDAFSA